MPFDTSSNALVHNGTHLRGAVAWTEAQLCAQPVGGRREGAIAGTLVGERSRKKICLRCNDIHLLTNGRTNVN